MKSRRILAAVLAPVCALSATAAVASAAETEDVVLSSEKRVLDSSWNSENYYRFENNDDVKAAKAGDALIVKISDVVGDKAAIQFFGIVDNGDTWLELPSAVADENHATDGAQLINLWSDDTEFMFVLTEKDIEVLREGTLVIGGCDLTLESAVIRPASALEPGATDEPIINERNEDIILSSEKKVLDDSWNWANFFQFKRNAALRDVEAGDSLIVNISDVVGDEASIQLLIPDGSSWVEMPSVIAHENHDSKEPIINLTSDVTQLRFVLTEEDTKLLNGGALTIGGNNFTLVSALIRPAGAPEPDTSKPAVSEPTASEPEKPAVFTNEVTVDKSIKGEDLTKATFGDSEKTWTDAEEVTFEADEPFAITFNVKAGKIKGDAAATKFIKGVTELTKEDELPAEAYSTKWTLTADEVAAMTDADPKAESIEIIAKDGKKISVKATVTVKAAEPGTTESNTTSSETSNGGSDNANTGIALAVAPVILAGAAVAVVTIGKKRK